LPLVADEQNHPLVTRASAIHGLEEIGRVRQLLDAAARGPEPAAGGLLALELLIAVADPDRFLRSELIEPLRGWQAEVQSELARALRVHARAGRNVVLLEYESRCRIEDLVGARWPGMRPGTVVLVANPGAVEGMVSLHARAAAPEAIEVLRAALGPECTALVTQPQYQSILTRLGIEPKALSHDEVHTDRMLN
jgi:hypothetical protein